MQPVRGRFGAERPERCTARADPQRLEAVLTLAASLEPASVTGWAVRDLMGSERSAVNSEEVRRGVSRRDRSTHRAARDLKTVAGGRMGQLDDSARGGEQSAPVRASFARGSVRRDRESTQSLSKITQ